METVTFQDIDVDRCTACEGLWFDALEREHLEALTGSEGVDVGPAGATAAVAPTTAKKKLSCPVCHTQMIDRVDHRQPDIHFESCQVCYGLFFDAGEFRHLKEHHVVGFFRRLFQGD